MAAGDVEILPLSGSTDGRPIVISGTSPGSAQTIHTATSASDELDLVWLWSSTLAATSVQYTVEWGTSGDEFQYDVDASTQVIEQMIAGFPLRNGLVIKAYSNIASTGRIVGYVQRYYGVTTAPDDGATSILPLSGSTDGRIIDFAGHTTTGTAVTIHTASSSSTEVDMVTLYAFHATGLLTLEWGGTTSSEQLEYDFSTSSPSEIQVVTRRLLLRNSKVLSAFHSTGSFGLIGYVERYNNG